MRHRCTHCKELVSLAGHQCRALELVPLNAGALLSVEKPPMRWPCQECRKRDAQQGAQLCWECDRRKNDALLRLAQLQGFSS